MSMKTKPLRRTTFKNLKICLLKWTYICVHYRLELPLCRWKWHWYNIWYMFVFSWSPHPHKSYHRPTRNARPKIPAGLKILRASEGDHRPWFRITPAGQRKLWKSFPIESLKLTFVFIEGLSLHCVAWNEISTIFGTRSCSLFLPTSTSPITRIPGTPVGKFRRAWENYECPIESLKLTFVFVTGSNFFCITWNEIDTIFGTCSCSCSLPTSTSPITRRPRTPGGKFRRAWK